MQVSRWGNSLAVRLPAAVVEQLKLKDGDNVEIDIVGDRKFEVRRTMTREEALEELRKIRWPAIPDYRFKREDAYER